MTGLINRMVQRTRGTMPGAEPLVRLHQTAAGASGTDESFIAPAAPAISTDSNSLPFPNTLAPRPMQDDRGLDARPGRTAIQSEPQTAPDDKAGFVPAPRPDDLPQPRKLDIGFSRRVPAERSPDPLVLEAPAFKEDLSNETAEPPAITSHGDSPSPKREMSPRQRKDVVAPKSEPTIARSRQAASPVEPLESATEHTEIHITIGSIELRASRAEAQSKPAPFKPRVTLDDYLRRRPGAGS
jgi:hypothetical protein